MKSLISLILFISGCVSAPPVALKDYYYYKPDTQISFDNHVFYSGIVAAKVSGPMNLYFTSPVKMDRVEITTCSRHDVKKAVDASWFGGSGKTLVYQYVPDVQESSGVCPLYIQTFSSQALTSWAMVMFYATADNVPAHLFCNGSGTTYSGVSVCSTEQGIPQEITFQQDVKFVSKGSCNKIQAVSNKDYLITPGIGFCEGIFSPDGKVFHKVNIHGYDKVL